MYFPTAEIEVFPLTPVLAGFVVSFFMSMGGISGAFLLLPFQMSVLGYVNPSVSATNQLYNVLSSPGGVYRYIREQRMVWPLVRVIMRGTAPGVIVGGLIRLLWLPEPGPFKVFVAVVLLVIASQVLRDLLRTRQAKQNGQTGQSKAQAWGEKRPTGCTVLSTGDPRRLVYSYAGSEYSVSVRQLLFVSIVIGLVGGAYGIGGGAIMAPFLVSFFRLPVYTVAGASLLATCLTAVIGVLFFLAAAPFFPQMTLVPDWRLALLFGLGGITGMYCGARAQKYVPDRLLKWMILLVLTGTACSYLRGM